MYLHSFTLCTSVIRLKSCIALWDVHEVHTARVTVHLLLHKGLAGCLWCPGCQIGLISCLAYNLRISRIGLKIKPHQGSESVLNSEQNQN